MSLYQDDMGSTFFKLFILFIFKWKYPFSFSSQNKKTLKSIDLSTPASRIDPFDGATLSPNNDILNGRASVKLCSLRLEDTGTCCH